MTASERGMTPVLRWFRRWWERHRPFAKPPAWVRVRYVPEFDILEERVVLSFTISGASSVLVGQEYVLTIDTIATQIFYIDWGDGADYSFADGPGDYYHTYNEAPQAFLISVRETDGEVIFGPAEELLVDVVTSQISTQSSTVVQPGTTDTAEIPGAVSATYTRADGTDPLVLLVSVYNTDPALGIGSGVSQTANGILVQSSLGSAFTVISYDVRATQPELGDSVVVRFTVPNGSTLANLLFFNPLTNTYMPVTGSLKTPNSFTRVGNTFTVVLDETSFPTIFQLNGTVFTIVEARVAAPPILPLITTNTLPPNTNSDPLAGLLDTGNGDAPSTGNAVGVVSPSQVNAFSSQSLVSAEESPEMVEGRRLARTIQSALDGIYDQMRRIIMPQLYFEPPPMDVPEPLPPANLDPVVPSVPIIEPSASIAEIPPELRQEIAIPAAPTLPIPSPFVERPSIDLSRLLNGRTLTALAMVALPALPLAEAAARRGDSRKRQQR